MGKRFDSLLAQGTPGYGPFGYEKQAGGVEAPDQGQLEQDFARLAYMFLQDRASGLLKYLLGFEVVNRDDDGARAVGIFGFKIGHEYYYVPAFFLNNQIKGVDILFSKRTNMFMPLTEDWVNFIINRQTIELGGGTNVDDIQRHFESPNFNFIASPPVGGAKWGSAEPVQKRTVGSSVDDTFDTWNVMRSWTAEHLEKDAEFQKAFGGFIAALTKDALPFEKTAADSPLIRYLEQTGGPGSVVRLLNGISKDVKFANAALTFYPDVKSLAITAFSTALAPVKKASKIEVVTSVGELCESDTEDKKRLVRDGFTIKDKRKDDEKTEVLNIDYIKRFSNPSKSGTYQVLLRGGSTTKAWVLMPEGQTGNRYAVVIEQDKRLHHVAEPEAIFVRDGEADQGDVKDKKDEPPSPYGKAVALIDMELDTPYVLLNQNGDTTRPFEVSSTVAEDGKRVRVRVRWPYCDKIKRPSYIHDFGNKCDHRMGELKDYDYFEFSDHPGQKLNVSGADTVVVPSNWKALKLYDGAQDDYEKRRALEDSFKLGTLNDVEAALVKNSFHRLTVASDDGLEFYFRVDDAQPTRPVAYKAAMVSLVSQYGLPVKAAEDMIGEATTTFKSRRLVKAAQYQSPMVGVSMPYPQEPPPSIDPYNGVPIYQENEQEMRGTMMGVPPKPQPGQYGMNLGGEADMDVNAMRLAEQAAQGGQKQIFDHAAIGGLSKTYDTGAVIDSYVPEMMKALDRIGRLIFLFYWKNEDFSERYGSNDMPEMEDLLRNVFKSFGEMVLKLRRKAIGSEDSNTVEM